MSSGEGSIGREVVMGVGGVGGMEAGGRRRKGGGSLFFEDGRSSNLRQHCSIFPGIKSERIKYNVLNGQQKIARVGLDL